MPLLSLWDIVAPTLIDILPSTDRIAQLLPLLSIFFRESEPILEDFLDIVDDAGILDALERRQRNGA